MLRNQANPTRHPGDGGDAGRRRRQALVPMDVLAAVQAVVLYLWRDEARHYQRCTSEERKAHIFRRLASIRNWMQMRGLWRQNRGLTNSITPLAPCGAFAVAAAP